MQTKTPEAPRLCPVRAWRDAQDGRAPATSSAANADDAHTRTRTRHHADDRDLAATLSRREEQRATVGELHLVFESEPAATERRRNRTFQPVGCTGLPVLKCVASASGEVFSGRLSVGQLAEFGSELPSSGHGSLVDVRSRVVAGNRVEPFP